MLKRDKNFRLSKPVKRMLAGKYCTNPSEIKKLMIEAQIASSIVVKNTKKKKDETEVD